MSEILKNTKLYLLGIMLLGVTSGAALNLVLFTIPYHLSEAGHGTGTIGAIFLTGLPYCLKPIWAPFIDRYSVPFLCKRFGQRRGWALLIQLCLSSSISLLLFISPSGDIRITAFIVIIISFFAAIQDIILDAYRIERPKTPKELSIATTFNAVGLRIGMLVSSAGALFISDILGWYFVYLGAFLISLAGPVIIYFLNEPIVKSRHTTTHLISLRQYFATLRDSIRMLKASKPQWPLIMLMILLYKVSDSVPMSMSAPFFLNLSFTSYEIALISKGYGLLVMIFGCTIGGLLLSRIGIERGFLICGIIQLLSPLAFMFLSMAQHDLLVFLVTTTIQNFASGLAGTALYIYISSLCNSEFVATQFSMISSFNSLARIFLSSSAGLLATHIAWTEFFILTTILSSCFVLVYWLVNRD